MISRPLPPIGSEPTNRARQYVPVRLAKVPEKDKAALPQSTVVEAIEDTADPGTRARYTLQSTVQSTVVEAIDDMPGLEVVLKAPTRDETTFVEDMHTRRVPSWWPQHLPRSSVDQVPTYVDPAPSQPRPEVVMYNVPDWWPRHATNREPQTHVYRVLDEWYGSDLRLPPQAMSPALPDFRDEKFVKMLMFHCSPASAEGKKPGDNSDRPFLSTSADISSLRQQQQQHPKRDHSPSSEGSSSEGSSNHRDIRYATLSKSHFIATINSCRGWPTVGDSK